LYTIVLDGDIITSFYNYIKYFYEFHINGLNIIELGRNVVPYQSTGMRRMTKFRSTTDLIYDGGPIIL